MQRSRSETHSRSLFLAALHVEVGGGDIIAERLNMAGSRRRVLTGINIGVAVGLHILSIESFILAQSEVIKRMSRGGLWSRKLHKSARCVGNKPTSYVLERCTWLVVK
jgi:hypothetical protein